GPRDLPQRQQALATAIDWSYALLDDAERAMFRRLAVFVGGCTLDAIERVCSRQPAVGRDELDVGRFESDNERTEAPPSNVEPRTSNVDLPTADCRLPTAHCRLPTDTLDVVASLVEKSLVRHELTASAEPRLRMLETIRAYALRELVASGEADLARARHAAFYLALAEQAAPELEGTEQAVWLDRLDD